MLLSPCSGKNTAGPLRGKGGTISLLPLELNRLLKRLVCNQAYPLHIFGNTIPPLNQGQFVLTKKKTSSRAQRREGGRSHHLCSRSAATPVCGTLWWQPEMWTSALENKQKGEMMVSALPLLSCSEEKTVICQRLFITGGRSCHPIWSGLAVAGPEQTVQAGGTSPHTHGHTQTHSTRYTCRSILHMSVHTTVCTFPLHNVVTQMSS